MSTTGTVATGQRKSLKFIHDNCEFYAHQIEGIRQLARKGNFILADDMGLGKSLQALTVFAIDVERGAAQRALVVCPVTLKWNWKEEIEKHTHFRAHVVHGNPKQRVDAIDDFVADKGHILIVNYEQVITHLADLNAIGFDIVIYDEAHVIKNPKAKRTKACHGLQGKRHFLLTGSPMLNHIHELWSLLYRIDPVEFNNYYRYLNRYCNTPDAPIWMADGTFKPIGKVQVGEKVIGWVRQDGRRSRVISTVKGVKTRLAPEIIEVTLKSGTIIKCTPDHVWLSGSHGGYAKTGIRVDTDIYAPIKYQGAGQPSWAGDYKCQIKCLSKAIVPSPELTSEQQRNADWLMGMYDGEGCKDIISQSKSHNPAIHARIGEVLTSLGIPYREFDMGYQLKGGIQTFTNLLHWCPQFIKRDYFLGRIFYGNRAWKSNPEFTAQFNRTTDEIVSVRSLGPGEVVSMQTSTGNYVAWGYASKNCVYGGFNGKQITGVKNESELREKLQDRMLRRTKDEVLGLPPKQYIPVWVGLTQAQKDLYREIKEEMQLTTPGIATPMEIENGMTKYLRLKQVCGTPACFDGHEDSSEKLDRAMEMAAELLDNGHKLVVFTQFRGVLKAFSERLAAAGMPYVDLHGNVPMERRQERINSWGETPTPGVLVAMLQVASVGLNLNAARHVFFLDKLWVPKLNEQAEDRVHRIGASTTQNVQIYQFLCRGTVEMRVEQLLKRKVKIFNTIVETADFKKRLYAALAEDDDDV